MFNILNILNIKYITKFFTIGIKFYIFYILLYSIFVLKIIYLLHFILHQVMTIIYFDWCTISSNHMHILQLCSIINKYYCVMS